MTAAIKNLMMIRQHGKIFHYFESPVKRDCWKALNYAHGRGWRVLNAHPSRPGWQTIECEPINVTKVGRWETEIPPPVKGIIREDW